MTKLAIHMTPEEKAARLAYQRQYYAANRDKVLEKRREQHARRVAEDPSYVEKRRAYGRERMRLHLSDPSNRAKARARRRAGTRMGKQLECQVTGGQAVRSLLPVTSGAHSRDNVGVDTCHLKPRKYCTKDERADPDNALRLDVRLHRLFDSLNVTVAPNGELMLHDGLPEDVATEWRGKRVSGYTPANDRYMSFHRKLAYHHGFTEERHASPTI